MQWLVTNWFWLLVDSAFVAMHMFGHGCHGGHGGHGGGSRPRGAGDGETGDTPRSGANTGMGGHQH
ncbi:MAG: DUF2933 domain-containing protein [Gemmatimonadales bacterium]